MTSDPGKVAIVRHVLEQGREQGVPVVICHGTPRCPSPNTLEDCQLCVRIDPLTELRTAEQICADMERVH